MELFLGIFSAFGLSASAGLNAYIPLFIISILAHYTDWIKLAPPYDVLSNPWISIFLGVLLIIEFLADKFPAINHINDIIHTFIRPAAGAIVFAASARVLTNISPVLSLICGVLIAGSVHTAKSVVIRPAVTAATGGVGNVPVSILEDIISTLTSLAAIIIPALVAFTVLLILLWWMFRREKADRVRT
ncbi:MAG: DUF4126 domain-containing protein [Chloroflexota bacterium]